MATLNDARLLEAAAETEALELDALAMHVAWQEDNDRHRKETQPGMLDLVSSIEASVLATLTQLVDVTQKRLGGPRLRLGVNTNQSIPILGPARAKNKTDEGIERRAAVRLRVLSTIHALLWTDTVSTKRDIYYIDVVLFRVQSLSDQAIELIARHLKCSRHEMNVLACAKGMVIGELILELVDATTHVCHKGVQIEPHWMTQIRDVIVPANLRFILVVEKDAVYRALIQENIIKAFYPCIVLTGKGFADLATRHLLAGVHNRAMHIPLLMLVDFDPAGISILNNYVSSQEPVAAAADTESTSDDENSPPPARPQRRRRTNRVFDNERHAELARLDLANVFWLGVHSWDAERVPPSQQSPLTRRDRVLLNNMLDDEKSIVRASWRIQMEMMLSMSAKVEIESMYSANQQLMPFLYEKLNDRSQWL